jgi:hypothetical protein
MVIIKKIEGVIYYDGEINFRRLYLCITWDSPASSPCIRQTHLADRSQFGFRSDSSPHLSGASAIASRIAARCNEVFRSVGLSILPHKSSW